MPGRALQGARTEAVEIVRFNFLTNSCSARPMFENAVRCPANVTLPLIIRQHAVRAPTILVVPYVHRAPYDV